MTAETKICQNCRTDFKVESEDFSFYEKIKVPAPTFCPKCRLQRRLAFFNLVNLYKRPCGLCKKEVISMYAPEAPYKVYCPLCWWSDKWNPLEYGRDYDVARPFFEQLNQLWHEVPLLGLAIDFPAAKNSPYNNYGGDIKNSYLTFHVGFNEDCAYGFEVLHSKSVVDCSVINSSELCYDSMNSFKNNRCIGSRDVFESMNCAFLLDSGNCQNCFASANLRGKKYYIFNKPHSKEDYFKEIKKWDLGSYKTYQEIKKQAEKHWKNFPPKPEHMEFSVRSTGSYVFRSKNCRECREVVGAEDSKHIFMCSYPPIKDCYDISSWGDDMELSYECLTSGDTYGLKFSYGCAEGVLDSEYSFSLGGGSNLFGCISLRNAEYAILNKRYSKKDFEKLRAKIIGHMDEMPYADKKGRTYRYGEFFPVELSPFAYNETVAQKFFPMTRENVLESGYQWRSKERTKYDITKKADDLPDHIKDAPAGITKEIIGCQKCGRGFKIIKMELDFLKRMNLPLPRECPFCRIDEKFDQWVKNLTLVKRTCDTCGIEFETPHTKEDSKRILCRKCWLQEVI
ncbi:MAG: hypothetical protein HY433_03110 [Candidatus Liptonbacteria bacterium]|nr:hypothetical protein [Candidatus Liptonbacteria bacterium]